MRGYLHKLVLLCVDFGLIALGTIFALVLRDNFELSLSRLQALLPYLVITLAIAALVLPALGTSRGIWRMSAMRDYVRLAAATVVIVGSAVAVTFFVHRLDGVARSLPVIQALLMLTALVGVRVGMRFRHAHRHQRQPPTPHLSDSGTEAVLLVGLTPITDLFLKSLSEFAPHRLQIVGILGRHERQRGRHLHHYPILGVPEDIDKILSKLEVHGVLVRRVLIMLSFAQLSSEAQSALLDVEKKSDIRLEFVSERLGLSDTGRSRAEAAEACGEAPIDVSQLKRAAQRPYFAVKRAIDVMTALALILVTFPLAAVVAVAVAIDVGYPVLFWQQRPGLGGHPFHLFKFRTMRAAHNVKGERVPDSERLSTVGRFLRRTRLDELPQFYNVLVGDMSFVGPRPLLPIDQPPEFAARLLVRPGLTGWAQIAGGREISAQDKSALDLWYVRNASFATDAKVVARTLPMIVFGERPDPQAIDEAWKQLGVTSRAIRAAPRSFVPALTGTSRSASRQHAV